MYTPSFSNTINTIVIIESVLLFICKYITVSLPKIHTHYESWFWSSRIDLQYYLVHWVQIFSTLRITQVLNLSTRYWIVDLLCKGTKINFQGMKMVAKDCTWKYTIFTILARFKRASRVLFCFWGYEHYFSLWFSFN